MKINEFKLKLTSGLNDLINVYFGESTVADKMINSTLKLIVKNNIHKLDDVMELLADKDGEINVHELVDEFVGQIDENGVHFDIKNFVKSDLVKSFLPDKILVITKDDIIKLLH